jgi:hypothetical protein
MAGSSRLWSILPLVISRRNPQDRFMSMFAVWCDRHGARVLLSGSSIESIANGPEGIVVRWRCTCGHQGTWRVGEAACTP